MKNKDMAFFHEGTLRICGSLDIEEVLESCFAFLKQFIPLSGILLDNFDPKIGGLCNVGQISDVKIRNLESPILISSDEIMMIKSQTQKVVMINDSKNDPLSSQLSSALGLKKASFIVLHLRVQTERLGVVIGFADGTHRFTEEHRQLLGLLHDPFAIAMSNTLRFQELDRLKDILKDDNRYLRHELHMLSGDEIIGENFGLKDVMDMVGQVARLDSNVLLLGETGVGKEVIANAIHFSSPRGTGPLIKVNCGAIPENLIDSELFGHEKGAFTGALSLKRGRFERAHTGTIFLDEIGELQPNAQVRLLRIIQDRKFERVGGTKPIPVDIRIITATNRNLEKMVKSGKFREDLWFRLNVFPITVPPLRQRKTDIPALVNYFIERKSHEMKLRHKPKLGSGALEHLKGYDWPGNVRELENAVERELIRCQAHNFNQPLLFSDFGSLKTASHPVTIAPDFFEDTIDLNLDQVVRNHIIPVLKMTKGKIQGKNGAAAKLGVHPSTLRHRLRKLKIPFGTKS